MSRNLQLLIALVAVSASLAITAWSPDGLLGTPAVVLGGFALLLFGAIRPLQLLPIVLVTWAPTLFVTSDFTVARVFNRDITLGQAFGVLIFVTFAGRALLASVRRPVSISVPLPLKFFATFACLMVVGLIRSPDRDGGAADFLHFAAGAAIVFCIILLPLTARVFLHIYLALVAGVVLAAIATFARAFVDPASASWLTQGVERLSGTLAGPGSTSSLMVTGLAALLPLVLLGRGLTRIVSVASAGIAVVVILGTVTRSALIGVPMLLLMLTWFAPIFDGSRRRAMIVLVAVCVIYISAGIAAGTTTVASRLRDVPGIGTASLTDDAAGTGRIGLWRVQAEGFLDASLSDKMLGRGLRSGFLISERQLGYHIPANVQVQGPHNSYLWLLNELGIFGLGVYGMFILTTILVFRHSVSTPAIVTEQRVRTTFEASFLAFFITYHLTSEMFGWNIPDFAGRLYFLTFLALAFRGHLQPSLYGTFERLAGTRVPLTEASNRFTDAPENPRCFPGQLNSP